MTDEKKQNEDELTEEQLEHVAGGSDAIQGVSQLQGTRSAESQVPLEAGELQIYEDQVTFTGNGVSTPKPILRRGG